MAIVRAVIQRVRNTVLSAFDSRGCDSLPYVLLAYAVFAVYSNCFNNAFLYDDAFLIVHNRFLKDPSTWLHLFTTFAGAGSDLPGNYYRPLQILLYGVVFQAFGLHYGGYHLLNVSLHAANACLVYALGRKLSFSPSAVFLASLIWAVHPIHTEAVTYMSATADTLYAFFCLGGLLVLLPSFSAGRIALAMPWLALGLLSKESATAFPLLAATVLYLVSDKRLSFRLYVKLWPLAALVGVYVVLHVVFADTSVPNTRAGIISLSAAQAGLQPFAALGLYLKLLLWPSGLHMGHAISTGGVARAAQAGLGVVLVAVVAALALRPQRRALLPLLWGSLWFFAASLPSIALGNIAYEHWMYLPAAGLFLGSAETAWQLLSEKLRPSFRNPLRVAFGMVVCVAGFVTFQQNTVWRDAETFYTHTIEAGEPSPNAHLNLGAYYAELGKHEAALEQYRLAGEDFATSTDTFTIDGRGVLEALIARSFMALPEKRSGTLEHVNKALAIDPNHVLILETASRYYRTWGDVEKAKMFEDKAVSMRQRFRQ